MISLKINPIISQISNITDYSILKYLHNKNLGADRVEISEYGDINISSVNQKLMRLMALGFIERLQKPSNTPSRGRKRYIYYISNEYQENDKIVDILEQIETLLKQFS